MKQEPTAAGGGATRVSLSERIRRDIEARILTGEWPPGFRIPFEHELIARYGCARMTVNKAISALVAAGLVVRRRRAGSFVAEPTTAERAILEIQDFLLDAERLGLPYQHRVVADKLDRLAGAEARRLGIAAGQPVRRLVCVHTIGKEPVALERRIIVLQSVPQARQQPFDEVPPGSWLLRLVPWSRAEHVVRAVNADDETARLLELAAGDACLVLERRTWQASALITEVRLSYPGARQSFFGSFTPASGEGR